MEDKIKLEIFLDTLLKSSQYCSLYPTEKIDLPVFKFFEPLSKTKIRLFPQDLVDFVRHRDYLIKEELNITEKNSLIFLEDFIIEENNTRQNSLGILFAHYMLPEISFDLLMFMLESFFYYTKKQFKDSSDFRKFGQFTISNYNKLIGITKDKEKIDLITEKIMEVNYTIQNF